MVLVILVLQYHFCPPIPDCRAGWKPCRSAFSLLQRFNAGKPSSYGSHDAQLRGKRNVIFKESKCWFSYCFFLMCVCTFRSYYLKFFCFLFFFSSDGPFFLFKTKVKRKKYTDLYHVLINAVQIISHKPLSDTYCIKAVLVCELILTFFSSSFIYDCNQTLFTDLFFF